MNKFKQLSKLILATAMLSMMDISTAQMPPAIGTPSITTDPFINNALNISNWQSGGRFDEFGDHRGSVANEQSTVTINPVMNFRMGSFSVQNATIGGTHYFETRFSNHPYWEHAPFDDIKSNSSSDKENFGNGSQSGYDISWDALMIHPSDGYDGAQGGVHPAPAGAYDAYYIGVEGFATATYFVPGWDTVNYPNNSKDPIENLANTHQSGKDKITSSIYSDKNVFEKILGVLNGTVEGTLGAAGALLGTPINNETEYAWNQVAHNALNAEVKAIQSVPLSYQNNYINFLGDSLTQESMVAVTNIASIWMTNSGIKNKPNIKPTVPSNALNHNYLSELSKQGIKYSSESIIRVEKMPDGKIIFLESGTSRSGLKHIIKEHGKEFAQNGVPESQIPKVIFDTLKKGKVIGQQGKDRPIYEATINGQKYELAITVGDNGYIVGANIRGRI